MHCGTNDLNASCRVEGISDTLIDLDDRHSEKEFRPVVVYPFSLESRYGSATIELVPDNVVTPLVVSIIFVAGVHIQLERNVDCPVVSDDRILPPSSDTWWVWRDGQGAAFIYAIAGTASSVRW